MQFLPFSTGTGNFSGSNLLSKGSGSTPTGSYSRKGNDSGQIRVGLELAEPMHDEEPVAKMKKQTPHAKTSAASAP